MGAMTIVEVIDAHDGFEIITSRLGTKSLTSLLWLVAWLTLGPPIKSFAGTADERVCSRWRGLSIRNRHFTRNAVQQSLSEQLQETRRRAIENAMDRTGRNKEKSAALLGMSRSAFYKELARLTQ
jgi:DNA-binding NtrC family response regulator